PCTLYTQCPLITTLFPYTSLFRSGSVAPGARPGGFSNPDLGWESTNILDFGVDVGFFNGRINTTIDYYISDTRDLLLSVPIPGIDRKSTRLNSSHVKISYAVFCLK